MISKSARSAFLLVLVPISFLTFNSVSWMRPTALGVGIQCLWTSSRRLKDSCIDILCNNLFIYLNSGPVWQCWLPCSRWDSAGHSKGPGWSRLWTAGSSSSRWWGWRRCWTWPASRRTGRCGRCMSRRWCQGCGRGKWSRYGRGPSRPRIWGWRGRTSWQSSSCRSYSWSPRPGAPAVSGRTCLQSRGDNPSGQ